ncbi:MAG: LysR family transcriptional regulator [Pigmentiphaga sp.]|uniref:LysR family transcriptional regulator n=1 Tax=Pigmentiphaga sp. TaxID=1977564 RepID=UPI0029BAAAD1|nr:LysR family transcriptional regulator [Pigmentiphaga sp.]MDX3906359.1 LysR family transcriptional regulator [Pigmentiphaga sp.]
MRITFRQLRAFVSTAQLNSFVEAARALHITQAALSNAVRELEDAVGFRLLERTTRRVRLSQEGEQFLPHAIHALDALKQIEQCAAELRGHHHVVKIATSRLVGWSLMTRIYHDFHAAHPDVRLTPVDVKVDDIRTSVEQGYVDLAISTHSPVAEHVLAIPLFHSRICVVCPQNHPLAHRKRLRWREIVDEPLIFVGNLPLLHLSKQLGPGYRFSQVRQVGDTTAALSLVAAGMGLAVCPGFVEPATRVHQLKVLKVEGPAVSRPYSLFVDSRRSSNAGVKRFSEFVLEYFARVGQRHVEDAPREVF